MTRQLYIICPDIMKGYIFFDGPKSEKNRREYFTLDELVNSIPVALEGVNLKKKKIEIHLEGFNPEQIKSIKFVLSTQIPKAEYVLD